LVRAHVLPQHVRSADFVARLSKSSVRHHAELPGSVASLEPTVPRPTLFPYTTLFRSREVGGGHGNREGRDPVSRVEVPRLTKLAGDGGRRKQCSHVSIPYEILHPSVRQEGLHVVMQDRSIGRRRRREAGNLPIGEGAR